ncbi:MAG: type III-B CRISPR module-associated Cmr3 family protein, partial [Candidatus Binatia bacterium]
GRLEDEVVHLPLTAETCKAFEGASWHDPDYLAQRDRDVPHGIWDTLLKRWAFAEGWQGNWEWGWCLECGRQTGKKGSTKPFPRFVQRRSTGTEAEPRYAYEVGKPVVERRAHTALNPTRGTAEFGLLFADELVVPDTIFCLCIRVQGQTQQELNDRIQRIKGWEKDKIRLGGAKSRGHGLIEFTRFARDDEAPKTEPLVDRLRRFDELVKRKANGNLETSRTYFVFTLQAPLILPDQDVYPDWCIRKGRNGDWKRVFLSVAALSDARLEFAQHRFTQVTGWSSLWQLPKPTLRALAAGNVYVFSTTANVSAVEPIAGELEFLGAGLFRPEGFGAINVGDPFHREVTIHGDTA